MPPDSEINRSFAENDPRPCGKKTLRGPRPKQCDDETNPATDCLPAGRAECRGVGAEGTRRDGLHCRMPPDARGGRTHRQGPWRTLARLLCQLARQRQPHARVCLYEDVALPEHRRGRDAREHGSQSQGRRAEGRKRPGRQSQVGRSGPCRGAGAAADADPPCGRHALPDAHGASLRSGWQPGAGGLFRQGDEPPRGVGYEPHRVGAPLELYRVARADRPATRRRGDASADGHAARLAARNAGNLRGGL